VYPHIHETCGPEPESLLVADIVKNFHGVAINDEMPDGPWWPQVEEDTALGYGHALKAAGWFRQEFGGTGEVVAAVSHGTFGAMLIGVLLGTPLNGTVAISQGNCCISRLTLETMRASQFSADAFSTKLWYVNDLSHQPPQFWS
jgi:broad specificity phosphatase PhoE